MSSELRYPKWQEPLAAAALEIESRRLLEKLQEVEKTVSRRIEEFTSATSDDDELRALHDGLSLTQCLRRETMKLSKGKAT